MLRQAAEVQHHNAIPFDLCDERPWFVCGATAVASLLQQTEQCHTTQRHTTQLELPMSAKPPSGNNMLCCHAKKLAFRNQCRRHKTCIEILSDA